MIHFGRAAYVALGIATANVAWFILQMFRTWGTSGHGEEGEWGLLTPVVVAPLTVAYGSLLGAVLLGARWHRLKWIPVVVFVANGVSMAATEIAREDVVANRPESSLVFWLLFWAAPVAAGVITWRSSKSSDDQ